MNWGSGDIIPNVAQDYVSIDWTGFLLPLYTEAYTFYVESNDGIRVYVNNVLLIDSLVDSTSDTDTHLITSASISLHAGQLVPIRI